MIDCFTMQMRRLSLVAGPLLLSQRQWLGPRRMRSARFVGYATRLQEHASASQDMSVAMAPEMRVQDQTVLSGMHCTPANHLMLPPHI